MINHKPTALVTGASGGIGRDLAHVFAENEYDLVVSARSEGKLYDLAGELQQKHGTETLVIPADLSRPDSPPMIFTQLQAAGIEPDVLVNNAGRATYGSFVELDLERELRMVRLNVAALIHLTGLFLPEMVARGRGKILNVASIAGFQGGPFMAVYYATKGFVLHFTEALAYECRGSGVTVTALCPGATATGFKSRAGMKNSLLWRFAVMDSRPVAEAGYAGLMAGKVVVIPGVANKLWGLLPRLLPRKMIAGILYHLQAEIPRDKF